MEILIILVERAGRLVLKEELLTQVWPNVFIEEGNVRVQINALRKALNDGRDGVQFINNIPGRGYSFVAPVTRSEVVAGHQSRTSRQTGNLPVRVTRIIGRTDSISVVCALIVRNRLVTVVGAAGVGKTTIAVAAAESLQPMFDQGVRFIDLATLVDPSLVPNAVAAALGLAILSTNPITGLLAFLRDKEYLLVLDNCEHLIEAVAELAQALLKGAPGIKILATSRELLRVEGERVHRLLPFILPDPSRRLNAAEAIESPAIQLFAERASANSDSFALSDQDAPILVEICRKLDGIPLAIELVAPAVSYIGIRELALRLEDQFQLSFKGYRTSAPRQQTLRATLDWSVATLTRSERSILSRIAQFRGTFTRKCVLAVASLGDLDADQISTSLNALVAKSLLAIDQTGEDTFFRLLDSTRAYAAEALRNDGESALIARRHAVRCRDLLVEAREDWRSISVKRWRFIYGARIDDIRSAIDWAFSLEGEVLLGIELTVLSVPLALQLSILVEYKARVQRALDLLTAGGCKHKTFEVELNVALGSLTFNTQGPIEAAEAYFLKALALTAGFADRSLRREAFGGMWIWTYGTGDYPQAVQFAKKILASVDEHDKASALVAERLMALSLFFLGDLAASSEMGERALADITKNVRLPCNSTLQQDRQVTMRLLMARTSWLRGLPAQAAAMARESFDVANSIQHSTSICSSLAFGSCLIAIWNGNWIEARHYNSILLDHATTHSLGYFRNWGVAYDLIICAQESGKLFEPNSRLLADLPALGAKQSDAIATISDHLVGSSAMRRVEEGTVGWCAPEILRAKGELVLRSGKHEAQREAGALFDASLRLARSQGALAWELRTAISLARLWRGEDRLVEACEMLDSVYGRFNEGFETHDLARARELMHELA